VVPLIADPIEVDALFAAMSSTPTESALLFVEPSVGLPVVRLSDVDTTAPAAATIIVGPEGGWTSDELARARGCRFVRRGDRTLRADAMASLAMAALFAHWREY
jgi:16S rRNA (uracil1498-N3)-methyltransferase